MGELRCRRSSSISGSASTPAARSSPGTTESWYRHARRPRRQRESPGNIVTGVLVGFQPAGLRATSGGAGHRAVQRFGTTHRRTSRAASAAACYGNGDDRERARHRAGAWSRRSSPGRCARRTSLQNTFAHESFMDEIAAQRQGRPGRVPPASPERSAADRRRSRRPRRRLGWEHAAIAAAGDAGHGIVQRPRVRQRGDGSRRPHNGWMAMAVDVEVNQDSGAVVVKRLVMPTTAARSRIRTGSGTSSKARRCRA